MSALDRDVESALAQAPGAVLAWTLFNGKLFATSTGALTQVALRLSIGPGLIATGMVWGAAIGLLGGLLPAVRAARMSVASALRAV